MRDPDTLWERYRTTPRAPALAGGLRTTVRRVRAATAAITVLYAASLTLASELPLVILTIPAEMFAVALWSFYEHQWSIFRWGKLHRGRPLGDRLYLEDRASLRWATPPPETTLALIHPSLLSPGGLWVIAPGVLEGFVLSPAPSAEAVLEAEGQPIEDLQVLGPLICRGCGAPLPLSPTEHTTCLRCSTSTMLPKIHARRHALTLETEARRAYASELLHRIPEPLPPVAERVLPVLPVLTPLVVLVASVNLATHVWAWPVDSSASVGAFLASVSFWVVLEHVLYRSIPPRHERTHSAWVTPGEPEILRCRGCGAALTVGEGAVVARCGYCLTESFVRHVRVAEVHALDEIAVGVQQTIDQAASAMAGLDASRRLIRAVLAPLVLPLLIIALLSLAGGP